MSEMSIHIKDIRCGSVVLVGVRWQLVPWYKRLWAVALLPFEVVRFVLTGKADFIKVKNIVGPLERVGK